MTHRNKSMKSIDLFSEACSRIIKEYNDNYIEEREDGYKVEEIVYFLDDNTEYYYDVHTPDGAKEQKARYMSRQKQVDLAKERNQKHIGPKEEVQNYKA